MAVGLAQFPQPVMDHLVPQGIADQFFRILLEQQVFGDFNDGAIATGHEPPCRCAETRIPAQFGHAQFSAKRSQIPLGKHPDQIEMNHPEIRINRELFIKQ